MSIFPQNGEDVVHDAVHNRIFIKKGSAAWWRIDELRAPGESWGEAFEMFVAAYQAVRKGAPA